MLLKHGYSLSAVDNMFYTDHIVAGSYFKLFGEREKTADIGMDLHTSNPTEDFINEFKNMSKKYNQLLQKAIEKI